MGLDLSKSDFFKSVSIIDGCGKNSRSENGKSRKKKISYHSVKNIDDFKKLIEKVDVGECIEPKTIGMIEARNNFYHWIVKLDNVKKINNKFYKIA